MVSTPRTVHTESRLIDFKLFKKGFITQTDGKGHKSPSTIADVFSLLSPLLL